ncbi:MAG TPA: alpha/beta hydrolase [Streptosporangiaceae bacterium]|nr:alpha/beta hydrolase [Streptosporangiaceae bacterium]
MDVTTFSSGRRTVATRGGEIAYTEFGEGPAALFVHGVATNGLLWRHVIEQVRDTSRCIAIDLPLHGGSPPRPDLTVAGLAEAVADLCETLDLDQVDLIGNDTGGAVAQIFAARYPGRLRTLTLTNCDTEGNFPPAEFAPLIKAAAAGQIADLLVAIAGDPSSWRTSPLAEGYEHPGLIPDEEWRSYFGPPDIERARDFERLLGAMDSRHLAAVHDDLSALRVPTLLVWGTGYPPFDVSWAHQLRDLIPGVRELVLVDGAKLFFPEERPADLVPHLRRHWAR